MSDVVGGDTSTSSVQIFNVECKVKTGIDHLADLTGGLLVWKNWNQNNHLSGLNQYSVNIEFKIK